MTSPGQAPDARGGAPTDRVQALAAAAVAPYGMLVDRVDIVPAGSRRIVRITLDPDLADLPADDHTSPVPPLDLDAVTDASRAVDEVLEREATVLFGDRPYLLEVGSSGAERRLTLARHYRANVGRLADVRLADGSALVARIVAAGPQTVTLRPEPGADAAGGRGGDGRGDRRGAGRGHRAGKGAPRGPVPVPPDRTLGYADIDHARTQVEFGRAWDEPLDRPPDVEDAPAGLDEPDTSEGLEQFDDAGASHERDRSATGVPPRTEAG